MATPLAHPVPVRRAKTTRRTILRATHALLLQHGSTRLTIRGVSEACGFKAPTIYHHFGDKNGLVDAVLEETFAELLAELRAVPEPPNPLHYLRELGRAFVTFCLDNPHHYALLSAPRSSSTQLLPSAEAARNLVFGAIEAAAAAGQLRRAPLETAFQATWALLNGLVSLRISRPTYPWAPDLLDHALEGMVRGLARAPEAEA